MTDPFQRRPRRAAPERPGRREAERASALQGGWPERSSGRPGARRPGPGLGRSGRGADLPGGSTGLGRPEGEGTEPPLVPLEFRVKAPTGQTRQRRSENRPQPAWSADDIFNEAEIEEDRQHSRDIRRAVLGSIAGVAMLVGPVVLSRAVVPDDDSVEMADAAGGLVPLKSAADEELAEALSTSPAQTPATADPNATAPPDTQPPPTEPPVTEPVVTTTEPPAPIETVPPGSGGFGDPYDYETWDALAQCESGGRWDYSDGPYFGGLQFSLSTWRAIGGTGYPYEHTREEQISMGIKLWERSGWGQWPACTEKLGLR